VINYRELYGLDVKSAFDFLFSKTYKGYDVIRQPLSIFGNELEGSWSQH
jgi:hypothetical protein